MHPACPRNTRHDRREERFFVSYLAASTCSSSGSRKTLACQSLPLARYCWGGSSLQGLKLKSPCALATSSSLRGQSGCPLIAVRSSCAGGATTSGRARRKVRHGSFMGCTFDLRSMVQWEVGIGQRQPRPAQRDTDHHCHRDVRNAASL